MLGHLVVACVVLKRLPTYYPELLGHVKQGRSDLLLCVFGKTNLDALWDRGCEVAT